jgi:hypothetical protein
MRNLVKKNVVRYEMHYTCEICGAETKTIIGDDFESDSVAMEHTASGFVNAWCVEDGHEVCYDCISIGRVIDHEPPGLGGFRSMRHGAHAALKHAKTIRMSRKGK